MRSKKVVKEKKEELYSWIVIGLPSFLYSIPGLLLFLDLHQIYTYIFLIYFLLLLLRFNFLIARYERII